MRLFSKQLVRKLLCCDRCKFRSLLLEEENDLAARRGAVLLQVSQSTEDKEGLVIPRCGSSQLLPSLHSSGYCSQASDAGLGSMGAAQVNHKSRHELKTHPNVTRAKQRTEPRSDNGK